jgi:hypothetical protein
MFSACASLKLSDLSKMVPKVHMPSVTFQCPPSLAAMDEKKFHPVVGMNTPTINVLGKCTEFVYDHPTDKPERFVGCIMQATTGPLGKVLLCGFRQVGFLSNHTKVPFQFGPVATNCREQAFVVARLCTIYKLLGDKDRADGKFFTNITDAIEAVCQAPSPHDSNVISRKTLLPAIFDDDMMASWDAVSTSVMLTVLLVSYSQNEEAFSAYKAFGDTMDQTHCVDTIIFCEMSDRMWGGNANGRPTFDAVLKALETKELSEETVVEVVKELGGQNKLGQAYNAFDAIFKSLKPDTAEEFRGQLKEHFGELVVEYTFTIEDSDSEPPAKVARSGSA